MDRKSELIRCLHRAISNMLTSTRGANAFGAKAQIYPGMERGVWVVSCDDGEYYFVKVQKSRWVNKQP